MKIEFLHQMPNLIHNCHRGNCVKKAKYTVTDQGEKVENLCGQHAKKFSAKSKIPMPSKS